jgi:uncharacterized protein YqjF (DUF2071 family)
MALQDVESRLHDYLSTPARQAAVVEESAHRPWPLPERGWVQAQSWERLLFAHWRLPSEALRPHVPSALPLDTFDGVAWLGVTPFRIGGLRVRGLLPLPVVSSFLEVNVRTYVTLEDKPGIFFFSLDAESALAVQAARWAYKLPYFLAAMNAHSDDGRIEYASRRTDQQGHRAVLHASYGPVGPPAPPALGSLEYFLTERYCLYTLHEGDVHWAEIHHPPWPLQPAEAEIEENTMPPPGIGLSGKPVCHYSERQDVVIWALTPFEPRAA